MSARRPILAIGHPEGDAAAILKETQCGYLAGFHNKALIKEHVLALYEGYKTGSLSIDSKGIEAYSREHLAGRIAGLLDNITA